MPAPRLQIQTVSRRGGACRHCLRSRRLRDQRAHPDDDRLHCRLPARHQSGCRQWHRRRSAVRDPRRSGPEPAEAARAVCRQYRANVAHTLENVDPTTNVPLAAKVCYNMAGIQFSAQVDTFQDIVKYTQGDVGSLLCGLCGFMWFVKVRPISAQRPHVKRSHRHGIPSSTASHRHSIVSHPAQSHLA